MTTVKADHWIDSEIGELEVEITAEVTRGDRDGPYIFHGLSIEVTRVMLGKEDITSQAMSSDRFSEIAYDAIVEAYDEAREAAVAYRAATYRHVDLEA